MSGVSDRPFRRLVSRFGCGLVYSEMIASRQMVGASEATLRMSETCGDERPMAIPVVGNGDITTVDDAKTLLEMSGADGVMVGRGSYGKPWFPAQVQEFLASGRRVSDPSLDQRCTILLDHYDALLSYYGRDKGIR